MKRYCITDDNKIIGFYVRKSKFLNKISKVFPFNLIEIPDNIGGKIFYPNELKDKYIRYAIDKTENPINCFESLEKAEIEVKKRKQGGTR